MKLSTGTVCGLAGSVVSLRASFLVGVLVARLLGPQGKGMLSVVLQVPGILVIVLLQGPIASVPGIKFAEQGVRDALVVTG